MTVTLWNAHHIFGIKILKQVNFKIIWKAWNSKHILLKKETMEYTSIYSNN